MDIGARPCSCDRADSECPQKFGGENGMECGYLGDEEEEDSKLVLI
jgi:hypothetical protein